MQLDRNADQPRCLGIAARRIDEAAELGLGHHQPEREEGDHRDDQRNRDREQPLVADPVEAGDHQRPGKATGQHQRDARNRCSSWPSVGDRRVELQPRGEQPVGAPPIAAASASASPTATQTGTPSRDQQRDHHPVSPAIAATDRSSPAGNDQRRARAAISPI